MGVCRLLDAACDDAAGGGLCFFRVRPGYSGRKPAREQPVIYWNGGRPGWGKQSPWNDAFGSGITATSATLTVGDASKLDLTQLPGATTDIVEHLSVRFEARDTHLCGYRGYPLGLLRRKGSERAKLEQRLVRRAGEGHRARNPLSNGRGGRRVCPLGAPGPSRAAYRSHPAPVTLNAGSKTVTGIGTNWASATGEPTPAPGDLCGAFPRPMAEFPFSS